MKLPRDLRARLAEIEALPAHILRALERHEEHERILGDILGQAVKAAGMLPETYAEIMTPVDPLVRDEMDYRVEQAFLLGLADDTPLPGCPLRLIEVAPGRYRLERSEH